MAVELRVIHSLKYALECIVEELEGDVRTDFSVRKVPDDKEAGYPYWEISLLTKKDCFFFSKTMKEPLFSVCDGRELEQADNTLYLTYSRDARVENLVNRSLVRYVRLERMDSLVVGGPPGKGEGRYSPKTR